VLLSRLKSVGLRLKAHWQARTSTEAFDAQWYCATYRDVARSGIDPLVHYLAYGRAEGRLPFLGAAPPIMSGYPAGTARVDKLSQILWNGFHHWAQPQLVELAGKGDSKATWSLACWHYAQGEVREALAWLGPGSEPDLKAFIGLVKCYSALGESEALSQLVERHRSSKPLISAMPYAEANVAESSEQRLAALNGVYWQQGLAPLRVLHAGKPLALSNVSADLSEMDPASLVEEGPLVSVVMAAYNAANTIETAVECLLAQTWQRIEVVVVDDASTDDTLAKVKQLASQDNRVRYLESTRNAGAYPARNRGMAQAQGEFVTVHDSDDWSHPQKLEKQLAPLLRSPELQASYSWWVRVTSDFKCVGSWVLGDSFLELNQSSWLVRRTALNSTGLWDEVNVGGDMEFATRLQHHFGHDSLESVLPDVPLAFSLTDPGSLTRTKATHISTLFHGLRRQYREAFSWWHRQSKGAPVMPASTDAPQERPFPTPLGNFRSGQRAYDALLVANFAVDGPALERTLAFLDEQHRACDSLCLFHWPERDAWHGNPVADAVFEWCQARGVHFAHFGIAIAARALVLADASLWQRPPSRAVEVSGIEKVVVVQGSLDNQKVDLVAYFNAGGITREAKHAVA